MIDFSCKKFEISEIIKCSLSLTRSEISLFLYLEKQQTFLSAQEISNKLSLDITTIQKGLKKLFEQGVIYRQQENLNKGGYIFSYKLKERDYVRSFIMKRVRKWVQKVEESL